MAIDWFGRTAGVCPDGVRPEDFDRQSYIPRPTPEGIEAADAAHPPTVMLIAGADTATPVDDQLGLAERMRTAGVDVEAVVYDGTPHSFFDRAYDEWADACQDALGARAGADRPRRPLTGVAGPPTTTCRRCWPTRTAAVPTSASSRPHRLHAGPPRNGARFPGRVRPPAPKAVRGRGEARLLGWAA